MGMVEELLIKATEVVTSVVLAWNLDVERITFVQAGKEEEAFHRDGEQVKRLNRAESMKKMREEISKMKEMSRREKASKTRRNQAVKAEDVNNYLIQDKSKRMVVVGADVDDQEDCKHL